MPTTWTWFIFIPGVFRLISIVLLISKDNGLSAIEIKTRAIRCFPEGVNILHTIDIVDSTIGPCYIESLERTITYCQLLFSVLSVSSSDWAQLIILATSTPATMHNKEYCTKWQSINRTLAHGTNNNRTYSSSTRHWINKNCIRPSPTWLRLPYPQARTVQEKTGSTLVHSADGHCWFTQGCPPLFSCTTLFSVLCTLSIVTGGYCRIIHYYMHIHTPVLNTP